MSVKQPRTDMVKEGRYRGLLTEREKEILSGEADVSDDYRYRVISRIRSKIEEIEEDRGVLEEHHPDLLKELREAVCEN